MSSNTQRSGVSGSLAYNKLQIWAKDKGFIIRVVFKDPVYGDIQLCSDIFDGIREADSRVFVLARVLGLERDTLPVCYPDGRKPKE